MDRMKGDGLKPLCVFAWLLAVLLAGCTAAVPMTSTSNTSQDADSTAVISATNWRMSVEPSIFYKGAGAMLLYEPLDGSPGVMRFDCGVLERLDTDWVPIAVLHPGHGTSAESGSQPEARPLRYKCEDLLRGEEGPDPIILPASLASGRFRFCIEGMTEANQNATAECVEFDVVDSR